MVDNTYRFLSGEEPTDEQLEGLMHAVAEEAKRKATEAEAKFRLLHLQQINEMRGIFQNLFNNNEKP